MKLHVGCGKVHLPDFLNLDIEPGPGVDVVDDARTLDSVSPGSCDLIYACHVLDHFGRHEYMDVLRVWYDRLRPGGILRLAVSDFRKVAEMYLDGHLSLPQCWGHVVGGQKSPYDQHGVVFDEVVLGTALLEIGFVRVCAWDWHTVSHGVVDDLSQAYWPHMDKEIGTLMSLNLEATK